MFELDLSFSDPSSPSYYYPVIVIYFLGFIGVNLYSMKLKNERMVDPNMSLSATLDGKFTYDKKFVYAKNSLKFRYLLTYCLTKSTVWAKSAYLYTLFSTYHKFSISEIGMLYVLDAVSALISGPILGNLADIYGRKRFCQLYTILIMANLSMRVSTNRILVYCAQILTGMCSGLIMTAFEAWLNAESSREFKKYKDERKRYLKKIFKTSDFNKAKHSGRCSLHLSVHLLRYFLRFSLNRLNLVFWPLSFSQS